MKIDGQKCILCGSQNVFLKFKKESIGASADLRACKECGLAFLAQEKEAIEEEDRYWDTTKQESVYLDEKVETSTEEDFQKKINLIATFASGGRLLDVGCGTGQFLNLARSKGWEVCGLDISPQAARIAKEKYGIRVFTGRPEAFDLQGASFDCVTMWDVIEHFKDPALPLAAMKRLLGDDGVLVIRTPDESAFIRTLARGLASFGIKTFLKYVYYTPHYFYFTEKTLRKLLAKSGLRIVGILRENTNQEFAQRKIEAHHATKEKTFVSMALPVIFFFSSLLRRQNKLVVFAKKIT